MGPEGSYIAKTLTEKYRALHEAFNALASEATQLQNSIAINDKKDRGLYNSLSRIVAFSDHVHVALSLMGEDVNAIGNTYGEPTISDWPDVDECFDEWFTRMGAANAKVH